VATIELPAKKWIELLDMLRNVVTNAQADMDLRKNSMNCLGSICEHTVGSREIEWKSVCLVCASERVWVSVNASMCVGERERKRENERERE
jgi:hypothetical protein